MHLIIDARCSNISLLMNHATLSKWMLELCEVIGMTPQGKPIIQDFPFPGGSDVPSACLFIKESAIVVHPYPEFDYVFIDVFSCKKFDTDRAIKFIEDTLGVVKRTTYLFQRGIDMESKEPLRLIPVLD